VTVDVEVPVQIAGATRDAAGFRVIRVGEVDTAVATRTAKFPAMRVTDLRDDDLVEVYRSDAGLKVYRVLEATWQDQATARRVPVVEVDRPEEWDA
jgi:hypothetical protein